MFNTSSTTIFRQMRLIWRDDAGYKEREVRKHKLLIFERIFEYVCAIEYQVRGDEGGVFSPQVQIWSSPGDYLPNFENNAQLPFVFLILATLLSTAVLN